MDEAQVVRDAGTALQQQAESDPHRPRFHFVAPWGWLNDPNGFGRWGGAYQLFYQHNPLAAEHHRIHWGHATSTDLVRWSDEPIALAPDEDGPDWDGCFSGVLLDDGGVPTLMYSGHSGGLLQVGCLATGSPDLREWTKHEANPVVVAPDGMDLVAFRDHCIWREAGMWRQLVGAGIRGQGGATLMFESSDLRTWRYLGPLLSSVDVETWLGGGRDSGEWLGEIWECPELIHLSADGQTSLPASQSTGNDLLVFSACAAKGDGPFHSLYMTGRYRDGSFVPKALHRLDLGENGFYAPQSFTDSDGRRVLIGWSPEERSRDAQRQAGWSGAMTLPRVVALAPDGSPLLAPVAEVSQLRGQHFAPVEPGAAVRLGAGHSISGPRGTQLDIEVDLRLGPLTSARLVVRHDPQDRERTVVEVGRDSASAAWLRLERAASSLDQTVVTKPRAGTIPLGSEGRVSMRVLVDHSLIEVFANGQPLTARVYPTLKGSDGTSLSAAGNGVEAGSAPDGEVVVERFEAWEMADIWAGRPRRPA